MNLKWELGLAVKTRSGKRGEVTSTGDGVSSVFRYPVAVLLTESKNTFTYQRNGARVADTQSDDLDIVGLWEEPKQAAIKCKHKNITPDHMLRIYECDDCKCIATFDDCGTADIHGDHEPDEVRAAMMVPDNFDPEKYTAPPANKTYTMDEYKEKMFGGPLNEHKAPPTPEFPEREIAKYMALSGRSRDECLDVARMLRKIQTKRDRVMDDLMSLADSVGTKEIPPTTESLRDVLAEALLSQKRIDAMLTRDNKPDDRRPRVSFETAKQRRREISQEILTSYRRTRAYSHTYNEMWTDLVELRAADKPESNRDARPWYEKT